MTYKPKRYSPKQYTGTNGIAMAKYHMQDLIIQKARAQEYTDIEVAAIKIARIEADMKAILRHFPIDALTTGWDAVNGAHLIPQ